MSINGITVSKTFPQLVTQRGQTLAKSDLGINTSIIPSLTGTNYFIGDQFITGNVNIISGALNNVTLGQLEIQDQYVLVNSAISAAPISDGGLIVNRGSSLDAVIRWNETSDRFEFGLSGSELPFINKPEVAAISAQCVNLSDNQIINGLKTFEQTILIKNTSTPSTDATIELGGGRTADGNAIIDFTSSAADPDYSARIVKYVGHNSQLDIINTGTGPVNVLSNGGVGSIVLLSGGNVGIGINNPSAKLNVAGNIQIDNGGSDNRIIAKGNNGVFETYNTTSAVSSYFFTDALGNTRVYPSSNSGLLIENSTGRSQFATTTQLDDLGILELYNSGATNPSASLTCKSIYGTAQFMNWINNGVRIGSRIKIGSAGNLYFTVGDDTVTEVILSSGEHGMNGYTPIVGDGGLQFPLSTTKANGISFYETRMFRSAANCIYVGAEGGTLGIGLHGSFVPEKVVGSNNGAQIHIGIPSPGISGGATAVIESSWGGAASPQMFVGVCRDSVSSGTYGMKASWATGIDFYVGLGSSKLNISDGAFTTVYRTGIVTDSTTGTINALSSSTGIVRLTGAAPDLRGLVAKEGAFVTIWFQNASTIRHLAGTATAVDRITTNTAADISINAGSAVQFFYDNTSTTWRLIRG